MRRGLRALAEGDELVRRRGRADLGTDRVLDAGEEPDVGAVDLPGALADPEEVRRAGVPVSRGRVAAHERLLVVEQQGLVARPHVDLVDRPLVAQVDADRLHEAERAPDLVRDPLVPPALLRARDELLVPGLHLRQVGEAALREGTEQVERRDRLVVRLHHPLGVRDPRLGRRLVRVNRVPAERRQVHPVDELGRRRPRLRELAGDPAQLDDRERCAVGEHCRHLEQHLEPLADRDRRDLPERLRAVSGLEEERASLDRLAERALERPRLAGEHERRQLPQALAHLVDRGGVRPAGLLQRRQRPPCRRCPGLGEGHQASLARRFLALRATNRYNQRHARRRPPPSLLALACVRAHRRPTGHLVLRSRSERKDRS